jgi:hypothetical protein
MTYCTAGAPDGQEKLRISMRRVKSEYNNEMLTFIKMTLGEHEQTFYLYDRQQTFEELCAMFPTAAVSGVPADA